MTTHRLVGYAWGGVLVEEYPVPAAILPLARALAWVPADDPAAVLCYALTAANAAVLADCLKVEFDPACSYFLEGFA